MNLSDIDKVLPLRRALIGLREMEDFLSGFPAAPAVMKVGGQSLELPNDKALDLVRSAAGTVHMELTALGVAVDE